MEFARKHGFDMYYIDAEQAFVQSELDEKFCMRLPQDVETSSEM